jgi:predicted dithiol-disulfide oxidoreductase (DUF899 family)
MTFARGRGWDRIRLLSSSKNTYNIDYRGEDEKEDQWPMANVFVRRDGAGGAGGSGGSGSAIHHFWGTEILYGKAPQGMDPRHADMFWPLWNLLDLTPEGRGTSWNPRLSY